MTPTVWGVPNALEGGEGTKSKVAHKWVDWLRHSCRLGVPTGGTSPRFYMLLPPPNISGPKAPRGGGEWRGGFREGAMGGGSSWRGRLRGGGRSRWDNLG